MEIDRSDIEHILALIDGAHFDEIHIDWKGLKLSLKRNQDGNFDTDEAAIFKLPSETIPSTLSEQQAKEESLSSVKPPSSSVYNEPNKDELQSGQLFTVTAPTVGIFYRRPNPSEPPFVDIGTKVKEGDTLCLIEVMKVFTAITASSSGTVVKILVDDNSMVEHDETLFLLDQNGD